MGLTRETWQVVRVGLRVGLRVRGEVGMEWRELILHLHLPVRWVDERDVVQTQALGGGADEGRAGCGRGLDHARDDVSAAGGEVVPVVPAHVGVDVEFPVAAGEGTGERYCFHCSRAPIPRQAREIEKKGKSVDILQHKIRRARAG